MAGGSLRVLRLLPPLKLVAIIIILAEILLKVALKHQKSKIKSEWSKYSFSSLS
jgi:hypothetical protein